MDNNIYNQGQHYGGYAPQNHPPAQTSAWDEFGSTQYLSQVNPWGQQDSYHQIPQPINQGAMNVMTDVPPAAQQEGFLGWVSPQQHVYDSTGAYPSSPSAFSPEPVASYSQNDQSYHNQWGHEQGHDNQNYQGAYPQESSALVPYAGTQTDIQSNQLQPLGPSYHEAGIDYEFQNALKEIFYNVTDKSSAEIEAMAASQNKKIPGMDVLKRYLNSNNARFDESRCFKLAINLMSTNNHIILDNNKDMHKPLKNPSPVLLSQQMGTIIKTGFDEALQIMDFTHRTRACLEATDTLSFNFLGGQNIDVEKYEDIRNKVHQTIQHSGPQSKESTLADAIATVANQLGSVQAQDETPTHLYIHTSGMGKTNSEDLKAACRAFFATNKFSQITFAVHQDADHLKWASFGSSGGRQVNQLQKIAAEFPGKIDLVDDYRAENLQSVHDYLYRIPMRFADQGLHRDMNLANATHYKTKTSETIKVAAPIICKLLLIGIKVAATI